MAEDLTEYYEDLNVRVRYMHSDVDVVERSKILHDLRAGEFDVLVGINLLREGLDLPEVSLVGIFDADKEGFLRSVRSLIQTCGRASRNAKGSVIMYADKITESMQITIDITEKRRQKQEAYNKLHGVIPKTIFREISPSLAPIKLDETIDVGEEIADHKSKVFCCGRTDRGVHALNQVIHFDTFSERENHEWLRGVNSL